ncbi:unnamed protein product, partial [Mesorhabditis belari]|uniref:Uncharacterized protein n=1 Tax=Mesorhabditis belari TaxID=2138241 RepID=A0AAF3EVA5_9BILA
MSSPHGSHNIQDKSVNQELDETYISKRKYNRDRIPGQRRMWSFGGIECGSMQLVQRRDAPTLLSIVQACVRPDSNLYTDL